MFAANYSPAKNFAGTNGNSIKIVPATAGVMSICDAKVFAKFQRSPTAQKDKTYCENWRRDCKLISLDEDKDNCLERFGQKKDASSCLNLESVEESTEEPKFYYPLRNKYECLTNY